MKLTIEAAQNGYVITENYRKDEVGEHEPRQVTYVVEHTKDLLHHVLNLYEMHSDFDEKVLYIVEAPGQEREDFTEEHARVIWGCQAEGSTP